MSGHSLTDALSGGAGVEAGRERFSFANRDHLGVFVAVLQLMGGVCDVCGMGTRRTSKRWAKCRNPECGARVRRRSDAEVSALLNERARSPDTEGGTDV